MAQPAAQFLARTLVRAQPLRSQQTFKNAALAAAGQFIANFEISSASVDRGSLLAGASPSPFAVNATGPFLDASAFSTQVGSIVISLAIDNGCTWRVLDTFPVAANDLYQIGGMRITSRFVQVIFNNLGAVAADVEFGVWVGSS